MWRLKIAGALVATIAVTWLLDEWIRSSAPGLFASNWAPWIVWSSMTITIGLAVGLAFLALRASPPDLAVALLLIMVGLAIGYSWPVAFTLGIQVPDLLTRWTRGPALVVWQALLVLAIGIAAAGRWWRTPRPPRARDGSG
jgi:hypothetical protein